MWRVCAATLIPIFKPPVTEWPPFYFSYDSIEDLTYVWRTRACENYLGIKIIKHDTQSNVFWGNFERTFWFWHLKASVRCIFWDFSHFKAKIGWKSPFWSDIFLTLHIEAWKSNIYTTSYWYFLTLNDKIGTSLYFKTTWTTVSYSYRFLEPLQDWR